MVSYVSSLEDSPQRKRHPLDTCPMILYNMEVIKAPLMQDTSVEQIYINFSQRSVKIVDDEGAYKTVNWKWDEEGSEGFAETVTQIAENVDSVLLLTLLH